MTRATSQAGGAALLGSDGAGVVPRLADHSPSGANWAEMPVMPPLTMERRVAFRVTSLRREAGMPTRDDDHTGTRIKEQRRLAGLTQRELSDRIPYSYSWLTQVECGA